MERSSDIDGSGELRGWEIKDVTTPITVKLFAEVAVADDVPDGVEIVATLWPGVARVEIDTWTVARVPSAFIDGGLPTEIPSAGIKLTCVAPFRLIPFIVRVKVAPTVCWMGMMEKISGSVEIWNIFAPETDGETFPEGVLTAIVLGPKAASAAIEIGTSIELPSGATTMLPIVIPVDGKMLTPVALFKLAPLMVSVILVVPGAPALGSIPVIADPRATPTGGARTGLMVIGVDGGGVFSSSTPTPGEITGLKVFEIAGGGGDWIVTPTNGDTRGDIVVPGIVTTVKVFAAEAISVVVPPGVVMAATL